VALLLLRGLLLLVLDALNDAVLVLFQLAFAVGALILMVVHIPLEDDRVLAVANATSTA
jgi:hypothetical protein